MKIEVIMDTGGVATAGVDRAALVDNIQAELDKLAATAKTAAPQPKAQPAPAGAQGDLSVLQWILDIAADPVMAKAYASGLVYAINQILNAARSEQSGDKADQTSGSDTDEKPVVKISIFGRDLALPVATAVIKKFLESLDGNG
ncbi:MAG: hypothetical protein JWQ89_1637 [Devosia sp.]|uniref:hypothetical protein n=1 Tax=Devosia sp. TaxID=1871048 RepID=UPI002618F91C|nr:hypothetical protein [Devosia sp.]MDB5539910.1 hypothetical protein [Devosia sp.]